MQERRVKEKIFIQLKIKFFLWFGINYKFENCSDKRKKICDKVYLTNFTFKSLCKVKSYNLEI